MLFPVPNTERVERMYRITEDRFDDECQTVLLAVTRPDPFPDNIGCLTRPRRTKDGQWFALFRVPLDCI